MKRNCENGKEEEEEGLRKEEEGVRKEETNSFSGGERIPIIEIKDSIFTKSFA